MVCICILNLQGLEAVLVTASCGAGLGYLGAALATAISFWLQFLTLLIYILFLKVCTPRPTTCLPAPPCPLLFPTSHYCIAQNHTHDLLC